MFYAMLICRYADADALMPMPDAFSMLLYFRERRLFTDAVY